MKFWHQIFVLNVISSDGRLIDYVGNNQSQKIYYFLWNYRFYHKFSYNSLFCFASYCRSHFEATSYQLFAPGGLGSIPCGMMYIFFFKILIFFCKSRQMFLQKLSNFLTKIVKIFLCKSSSFPEKIVKFSCKSFLTILHKLLNFLPKISRFSCKNRQIFLKDRQIFLQKSLYFSAKIVEFFCKINQNF